MGFFDNLTSNGIFFFLIVVFLVIVVIALSVVLLKKNNKLKKFVEKETIKEREEEKEFIPLVSNNVKNEEVSEVEEPIDLFKIDEREEEIFFTPKGIKEEIKTEEEPKVEIKEEIKIEEVKKEKPKIEVSTPGAYQRNVLREMSRRMPTSPIHIDKSDYDDANIYTVTSKIDNEIDSINLREDNTSPLEDMKDNYEINDSMRFASEIVSKMEEEMKPSNIELTDYEKKQEEEAIISYDELQKVKDRIYNITEEEETDEFIDELKDFRLDLR